MCLASHDLVELVGPAVQVLQQRIVIMGKIGTQGCGRQNHQVQSDKGRADEFTVAETGGCTRIRQIAQVLDAHITDGEQTAYGQKQQ